MGGVKIPKLSVNNMTAKKKEIRDEIIALFRGRRFTIVTHDRGDYSIYVGHFFDYEHLPEKPDYSVQDGGMDDEGYIPAIVTYLTEALGGSNLSI